MAERIANNSPRFKSWAIICAEMSFEFITPSGFAGQWHSAFAERLKKVHGGVPHLWKGLKNIFRAFRSYGKA
jgi:hypothetical protein